uniref:Uncharacterized protein n=1 Tax=Anguilla anguilla TaxID=7936 RepID=A0A0E9PUU0_ANGAN
MGIGERVGGSGVSGIDDGFVPDWHSSIPAAVALLLLDTGIVSGLVPGVSKVRNHVRPQALVL